MTVVTRFAPSPTGNLHIGSARTALFNYLFARKHNGKFLLRIEDTDKQRSTKPAVDAIFEGLKWLGIDYDDEVVFQSEREARHKEIALKMVEMGKAYYCYTPQEEINELREQAIKENKSFLFRSSWRTSNSTSPSGGKGVIRLKASQTGETVINDLIQGQVTVKNDHLDDMVLLRSDGTPTYMLAVVVDDHDMGITHVIRGDDHLNNAFRQVQIYKAMEWQVPEFAHMPLIHGADGSKLSKRHGATNVIDYEQMGFLPEAMLNYLVRLGWSYGDQEIFSKPEAIQYFDLKSVGKSPARFDMDKLLSLNSHYLTQLGQERLISLLETKKNQQFSPIIIQRLNVGLSGLIKRTATITELANAAEIYTKDKVILTNDASDKLKSADLTPLRKLKTSLEVLNHWQESEIQTLLKDFCKEHNIKMGDIGPLIRIALTGSLNSPSIFEMMFALGKEETLNRINKIL
ncbi:glutamate--tRNA ligase [Rickettsiales endosymbiont of Stachyamoeba lipophora]|uniref:glutamate--tRNA ligase n=1 Tax=Rickettsiales endosymbiont of Stachyamoeba lipophora TaxID=2486578 RepID=UPI000F647359|nr:glutamate--tRNA ligase [Rickettsiales endosymbiont of Stachyamoeba lipophora]AZL14973.1 glutamate--tRNA ligase [Rickettsiales endosymbiont of Stachyamoeba lipophora]